MATIRDRTTLSDFLSATVGSREAGLVIAKDAKELKKFAAELNENGLKPLASIFDYRNADHGWYIGVTEKKTFKEIYDFVCQYPLTVISLFDSGRSETVVMKPEYQKPFVLLIAKDALKEFQQAGFDLLGRVGPAYRS